MLSWESEFPARKDDTRIRAAKQIPMLCHSKKAVWQNPGTHSVRRATGSLTTPDTRCVLELREEAGKPDLPIWLKSTQGR